MGDGERAGQAVPRASRRPRGASSRSSCWPPSHVLRTTPASGNPSYGADRVLVVELGLVDDECLVGGEHRNVSGIAQGDVPLGGETDLAGGVFGHPPHNVEQGVTTTAGLGPDSGQAQLQRRDAAPGDTEVPDVEAFEFGGARRVIGDDAVDGAVGQPAPQQLSVAGFPDRRATLELSCPAGISSAMNDR